MVELMQEAGEWVEGEVKVRGRLRERVEEWVRIGANPVVVEWIRNGITIEIKGDIHPGRESIPLTEEQQMWVQQELQRACRVGAIEMVSQDEIAARVKLVSPVFVVPKKGPKKYRLVHDLRGLNVAVPDRPVKMETLSTLARMAGKEWWMVTFDLAQGYHHLEMHSEAAKFLGFRFQGRMYRYMVLPFGLKTAPAIFTKVVREMVKALRKMGVHLISYIDDFCIVAPSQEEA